MAQRVKDLALSLPWLWLQLWCGVSLWPGNVHLLQVWPKKRGGVLSNLPGTACCMWGTCVVGCVYVCMHACVVSVVCVYMCLRACVHVSGDCGLCVVCVYVYVNVSVRGEKDVCVLCVCARVLFPTPLHQRTSQSG